MCRSGIIIEAFHKASSNPVPGSHYYGLWPQVECHLSNTHYSFISVIHAENKLILCVNAVMFEFPESSLSNKTKYT